MVAFAGKKYAARSPLAFVANSTYTVTSFTLVRVVNHGPDELSFWSVIERLGWSFHLIRC